MSAATGSFVGRSAELADVERLLDRAVRVGVGGSVVVSGEAGIGKTALAEQITVAARTRGYEPAWATCRPTPSAPALQPWTDVLDALETPSSPRPDLQATGPDADAGRDARGHAVRRWLRERAGGPVLVVIDDVHWADAATLSLCGRVAAAVRTLPVVVVYTHRPPAAETASAADLAELRRHALVLELAGLDDGELAELLTVTSGRAVTGTEARTLRELTGGNPLFAHVMERAGHRGDDAALPATVRAVVGERLAGAARPVRELLDLVGVIGDATSVAMLADLGDRTPQAVLALVDDARGLDVLRCDGDTVAFRHELFRRAVYDAIPLADRATLHARVAAAFVRYRERGATVPSSALAHHLGRAATPGGRSAAARYALDAAREAAGSLAFDVAVRHLEQVLARDDDPGTGDRASLLCELADARSAAGDVAGARAAFRDAATVARRRDDPDTLARAALGRSGSAGGIEVAVRDAEAIGLLRDAAAALDGDDVAGARVTARLSVALSYVATPVERAALADDARARADRGGDPVARGEALAAWCDTHAGPADVGRRRAAAAEIVRIAEAVRDPRLEALGRRLLVVALLESGDLGGAEAEAGRYAVPASRLGRAEYGWYPSLWRAAVALARGDLPRRDRWREELQALVDAAASPNAGLMALVHDAISSVDLGRSGYAPRFLRDVAGVAEIADTIDDTQLQITIARVHLLGGDPDAARTVLDRCADAALAATPDSEWPATMMQAAEVVVGIGGHPLLGALRAAIEPYRTVWAVEGLGAVVRGPLDRVLGGLAAVDGDTAAAARHFHAAAHAARSAGALLVAAAVDHDAGVLLADPAATARAARAWNAVGAADRLADLERAGAAPPAAVPASVNRFARDGDVWSVAFGGTTAVLPDRKGLGDLARLLARPHREIAALDLAGAGGTVVEADLGEAVDATARDAYRARLTRLDEELADADDRGDAGRSAVLAAERDALVDQLTAAYGVGGRARRTGGSAERARTAVRSRIRDALDRITRAHPDLGRHLTRSVRTGTFCVYDPDPAVVWDTGGRSHTV